jgi:DNA-binding MarR family transcriptional regulator
MAETVATLREDGLVSTDQDPDDRRKMLIRTTAKGETLVRTIPAAREAWLDRAIRTNLDPTDQQTLLAAAAIMNRLADS